MSADTKNPMPGAPGTHSFSGSCAPAYGGQPRPRGLGMDTFSLGVFEWVPAASGKAVKRGPVKVRIKAAAGCLNRATDKAREVAAALDAGTYSGPKTVRV